MTKHKIEIDYYSTSFCGPCKMFKPVFEQFAAAHPEVVCNSLIIDGLPENDVKPLNITSVPTLIFYKDGMEVDRIVGTKSKLALEQKLEDITF